MTDSITNALEIVKRAKSARDDGNLDLAEKRIRAALKTLEDLWAEHGGVITKRGADATLEQKDLVAALAEAYGVRGGILRSATKYKEAVLAYESGFIFEQSPARKKDNTYNLLQRLFNRVLAFPQLVGLKQWAPEGFDMWAMSEAAEKEIERQLLATRRGDPWALADLILIRLLRGLEQPDGGRKAIDDAWSRFTAVRPQHFVYKSNVRAMGDLTRDLRLVEVRTRPVDLLLEGAEYLLRKFESSLSVAS